MATKGIPTWDDVLLPKSFPAYIEGLDDYSVINYMVNARVHHVVNKIAYHYTCTRCGFMKEVSRQYEDYYECEKCKRHVIQGCPFWKETKAGIHPVEVYDVSAIVKQMQRNYILYFKKVAGKILEQHWDGLFSSKFAGGETFRSPSATQSVVRAALCCPYIWDHRFDWNTGEFDQDRSLHMLHIINQWVT